jgi:hypothetical protein
MKERVQKNQKIFTNTLAVFHAIRIDHGHQRGGPNGFDFAKGD